MNNDIFGKIRRFFSKFKLPIALFTLGVALLLFGNASPEKDSDSDVGTNTYYENAEVYTELLEKKIRSLLSELDGVSDVNVLLTLDGGNERIYAENSSAGSVDYLIINGSDGEEAVLVREIYSSVRGIAVVCKGGSTAETRRIITELLAAAFDLPYTKISVAGTE